MEVGSPDVATKPCPFCGEPILAVAIKCKHCQSALTTVPAPAVAPKSGDPYGTLLMLVPWLGVALVWFWAGESPLLTASSNLTTVVAIVVFGSALLAALDASALRFGVKGSPGEKASGPGATFAYVALLWFATYPAHINARGKYGGRGSSLAGALLGVVAFVASAGYIAYLIDEKLRGIRTAFGGY